MANELDINVLRELISYDADTGLFQWQHRSERHFPTTAAYLRWNARWAGKQAFSTRTAMGYESGQIFARTFKAHRVAWAMHHGEWPQDQIDHINGHKSDNRISNLRVVSQTENLRNKPIPKNNTSGCPGVSWHRTSGKWLAGIGAGNGRISLGYFKRFEDAVAARKSAEQSLNYHENHGRN